jgi:hypothetical protein
MAKFTVHLGGGLGYQLNDPVSSNELNLTAFDLVKAPNFDEGSAHIPSADIELTGPFGLKLMQGLLLKYEPVTVVRRQSIVGNWTSGEWDYLGPNSLILEQTAVSGGVTQVAIVPLIRLPHNGTLSTITVYWEGQTGHASDPIDSGGLVLPQLSAYYMTQTGGVNLLGNVSDLAGQSRAAYEATHAISLTGIAHTIDLVNNEYFIGFTGEYGTDYLAGGVFKSLKTWCEVTEQDKY